MPLKSLFDSILDKTLGKYIDKRFDVQKENRKEKRKWANEVIAIVTEGQNCGWKNKSTDIRHAMFISNQVMQHDEDLQKVFDKMITRWQLFCENVDKGIILSGSGLKNFNDDLKELDGLARQLLKDVKRLKS